METWRNKNQNKGLSLQGFSGDDIAKVQDALNPKHRMTLGYASKLAHGMAPWLLRLS
ncbi:hypothetical protein Nizo2535_0998 [Lactiplantibacillus plantarum]|nr:hypothetical protein Nizo2535_0998 [Lactiplantibacillus plantarum]KZU75115.1 hypothetical protein Nizo2891_2866 [Lactiplantibacillus plantarum]